MKIIFVLAFTFLSLSVFAANQPNCTAKKLGPACQQICSACVSAGFIVGEAKIGDGFWVDCVHPLMTGSAEPAKAVKAGHPLPAAPSGGWAPVAAQCQASNPNWGSKGGGH
jgi:hypothetical protein